MPLVHLDQATADTLNRLAGEPPLPPADLRTLIDAHLAMVREVAMSDPSVDAATATAIHGVCTTLLDRWPELPPRHHRWVHAACRYFAQTHDGEDDLASIVGFDDDAEAVVNVLERLDLHDLIPLLDPEAR